MCAPPQGGAVDVAVHVHTAAIEVVVGNDVPTAAGRSAGYAVGLASARERVHALTDGRGELAAGLVEGRYVARLRLPLAGRVGKPPSY